MILFTGRYSGLIEPDEHYIELKKDFSNIDSVLSRLDDLASLEAMADRAYDRLVGSGDFSYQQFVELIDRTILRKARELGVPLRLPQGGSAYRNFDPAAFASLRERPTDAPQHFALFKCKQLAHENRVLREEIARLDRVYTAEIARLNGIILHIREHAFRTCGRQTAKAALAIFGGRHVRRLLQKTRGI
jgi:hypothetical protein